MTYCHRLNIRPAATPWYLVQKLEPPIVVKITAQTLNAKHRLTTDRESLLSAKRMTKAAPIGRLFHE